MNLANLKWIAALAIAGIFLAWLIIAYALRPLYKVKQQAEQIAKLSQQLEHSYGQVQDIALKAIEGSSMSRPVAQAATLPLAERIPRNQPDD